METYGRERRHRYFTLAAYKCVMANEQLQDTTISVIDVDLSRVGDFAALDPKHFYTTTGKLHSYQDSFKDITTAKGKKRKRDEGASDGEENEPLPKPKRGRPRKTPGLTDASTTTLKKCGRPRKNTLAKESEAQGAAAEGPLSERMAEVYAEGDGQAIANVAPIAGQAIVASQLADEASLDAVSHILQFEQNVLRPSGGGSALVDSNQKSASATAGCSRVMHPVIQSTGVLQANRPPERCDVISHQALEGVGDVQPRHSTQRAGTIVFNVDYHSIAKPKDGAMGSGGPQLLEKGVPEGNSLASVAQEEGSTSISTVSAFHMFLA